MKHIGKFDMKFIGDLGFLSISNGLSAGVKFILFIFIAKILGPNLYGEWIVINTLLGYIAFSHLGILNAMNREIPYYIGKNKPEEVIIIQSASYSFVLIISIVIIFVAILYSVYTGLLFYFLISLFYASSLIYRYFELWLKSNQLFKSLAILQLITILTLLFGIPLSKYYLLNGWVLANSLPYFIAILIGSIALKVPVYLRKISKKKIFSLIKLGFPIMLVGVSYTLFLTAERWVILYFLGNEALGHYALAITVFAISSLIPNIIADQFYPRIIRNFGEDGCYKNILSYAKKQILITVLIAFIVNIIIFFFFPIIVKTWLPDYVVGIAPLKIMLVFFTILPVGYAWTSILNIINKQNMALLIQSIFILIKVIITGVFAFFTKDLNYIAFAAGITLLLYSTILTIYGITFLNKKIGK